ncbi:hypothetical protein [Ekhidna sp.]|uniref:hypothetical protein n=1 Tax=Ekhidna sp. TaxID=2608089 RepID=UPI003B509563
MKKISITLLISAFCSCLGFAQTPQQDDVIYKSAIDWLNGKLNYVYFDSKGQQWWKNTFYANEDKQITIKHIVSEKPNTAHIENKTYTIRTFNIQDINPNSLKITDIKKTRGRIVEGQMLELRTFNFQDLIHKKINNRKASSTSFLFLSFPKDITDSIANYAEIVKVKFEEAIWATTQIYPSDYEHDIDRIISVLTGSFQTKEGAIWKTELVRPHVLKLDRGNGNIEYFGYDNNDHRFYLITITAQGIVEQHFTLENDELLILSGEDNPAVFEITNQNAFKFLNRLFFRQ